MDKAKPITDRTFEFAISVVKLAQKIDKQSSSSTTVMAKQLLRSGTSIGANVDKTKEGQGTTAWMQKVDCVRNKQSRLRRDHAVEEAQGGQSRADFISKMSIALKEARETLNWLRFHWLPGINSEKHKRKKVTQ